MISELKIPGHQPHGILHPRDRLHPEHRDRRLYATPYLRAVCVMAIQALFKRSRRACLAFQANHGDLRPHAYASF